MANGGEVEAACGQLANAVEAMMNPVSTTQVRMEAFKFCEQFKEQSSPGFGVQCGLLLCQKPSGPIRHFGLKLLEEIIKLKWNDMTPEEKLFVKNNSMKLMESGTADLLVEARHIKDAISRNIVEIAKREWPQQWPLFLNELEALCQKGNSQTELVMMVMVRLVEDVAVLQTLEQTQRRKEIHQALNAEMLTIFTFLQGLLERHYQAYVKGEDQERHGRVCQAVLETFNAFVEWVPMVHIVANDFYLLRCLCHLLTDHLLQLHAAECLLSVVSWKVGKIQDRAQLMVLFKTDMMAPLFNAVERAQSQSVDEHHYVFLKKMVQVLVELGNQLSAVWGSKDLKVHSNNRPENFNIYLDAILAFTKHPSITINFYANNLWGQLCRHNEISQDEVFVQILPKWIETAAKKVIKLGFPSTSDHPSSPYSQLDFETDEEFSSYFGKNRIILLEIFKSISTVRPLMPYQFVDSWLRNVLQRPIDQEVAGWRGNHQAPVLAELEAIPLVLDAILSRCSFQNAENEETKLILNPALDLLKISLGYQSSHPLVISAVLSCISSLFVVVVVTPDALMPILNKIFSCITFGSNGNGLATDLSPGAFSLRRHGCALLVKIGTRHPKTLVPVLEHLRSTVVDDLHKRRNVLHKMEYVTLIEGLILISNEVADYGTQSVFLRSLSDPICEKMRSLATSLSSVESFINFVGFGQQTRSLEEYQSNRKDISFCIQFFLAISRRAVPPSDIPTCQQRGFVDPVAQTDGNKIALRSPGAEPCCAIINQVFVLAKTLHDLWIPDNRTKISQNYQKVLDMLVIEKNNILGVHSRCSSECPESEETSSEPTQKDQSNDLSRAQYFLFEQFENIYHLLSQYCVNFGHEFFRQPHLAEGIVTFILQGLPNLPDYRLRAVLRTFLKSLINKCPASHFSIVLAPVFNFFCPYMLTRLTNRWDEVIKMRENPNFDQDNTDSAEVIADVINCQLTREYLDVIKAILTSGGGSDISPKSEEHNGNSHYLSLSQLGQLVIEHDGLGQCLIQTLLRALLWPDSPTSARASSLLEAIMPNLSRNDQLGDSDAGHIMFTILSAIHELGQHETNYIPLTQLAVHTYELLRPKHSSVAEVLSQVPGAHQDDMRKFDARVMQLAATGKVGDRNLKAMFKKLITQFTGVDIAQRFRKDVVIKNLPTLQLLKPRAKNPSLDETESKDIGLSNLFTSPGKSGAENAAVNGTKQFML